MSKRLAGALAIGAVGSVLLAGCGGGSTPSTGGAPAGSASAADVTGDITVLTNRTDLVQDGTFKKYTAAFTKLHPDVKVTVQGLTDYAGEVKVRMNTKNYGDVLLIPPTIKKGDYPKFFSSLGSAAELSEKYRYTDFTTVDDKVYGLAQNGNANGFVYNKAAWKAAGVAQDATTPQQFLDDLTAIKDEGTAIPYYTNYKDGWPIGGWQGALGSATCSTAANDDLATDKAPWTEGKDLATIDGLLFDVVEGGLSEPDPTTTNWEASKTLLGTGKVATMWLGSWAVSQMQDAAKKAGADPADIGLMPFPAQKDGKFCSVTSPDYNQAINVNSEHQAAARAWIDWFTDTSGYAVSQGSIPTPKAGELPSTLADYTALGVTYIELDQSKAAEVNEIDGTSEVGLYAPDYRQRIVDVARGAAPGDKASIFGELNQKWADGVDTAGL